MRIAEDSSRPTTSIARHAGNIGKNAQIIRSKIMQHRRHRGHRHHPGTPPTTAIPNQTTLAGMDGKATGLQVRAQEADSRSRNNREDAMGKAKELETREKARVASR